MQSELVKIVGSLGLVTVTFIIAAVIFRRIFVNRAQAWRSVIEAEGGALKPRLGLNAVLCAKVALQNGSQLWFEQWEMRTAGMSFGQVVIKIRNSKWSIAPFFVGADGHASAFARWALKLQRVVGPGRPPLDEARAADARVIERLMPPTIVAQLEAFEAFFVCGTHGVVRLHVPGGARGAGAQDSVRKWVELAKAIEEAVDRGLSI